MASTNTHHKTLNGENPKFKLLFLSKCVLVVLVLSFGYIYLDVKPDYSHNYPKPKMSHTVEDILYFERFLLSEHDPLDLNFPVSLENADLHVNPKHVGSTNLCPTRTKPVHCSSNNTGRCVKISIVGLCGGWATVLRKLPVKITCPAFEKTDIFLDHVGEVERIKEAHVVLFSFAANYLDMNVWLKLRFYRSPGQMWVFQSEESPVYARGYMMPWFFRNDTYNISNTYHTSADIPSPYGYYEPFRNENSNPVVNFTQLLKDKTNLIIWICSHCETLQWDRTKFVLDLQRVIYVDTFGKCGNLSVCGETWKATCNNEIDKRVSTYKFSLALENSYCEDYVTEKLWHALVIGTVPIVIGPRFENYNKVAPPGSFIHVDQFKSMEHLRDYLEYLDKNDTAYLEYFKWKSVGTVREHSIREHYQNHLSNDVLCSIADQYFQRQSSPNEFKMFDLYGPEWKGTCHHCGKHMWIRNYEHPLDHRRKNQHIWA
ncbi:Alpha-(1,3)-fucosyltransferase 4 [Holothuria leucospilota]|uniref:Fucosyltransferase n=1 Tax=Holothuria leucospilota TaxID=206669 RepID=A0A9Q1CJQ8_HOLLE|nr:Alpha-(1,3)-fucosyltransferase 4 [Holothuria leucospilota]